MCMGLYFLLALAGGSYNSLLPRNGFFAWHMGYRITTGYWYHGARLL